MLIQSVHSVKIVEEDACPFDFISGIYGGMSRCGSFQVSTSNPQVAGNSHVSMCVHCFERNFYGDREQNLEKRKI